ncbi:MAG TPA: ferritin-like protein [Pyrinomonadaceae bacterium]|jgi:hypothetical protein
MKQTIHELLQVEIKDVNWLKTALQSAVELEFSTIPPYLTAMWSIKDQTNDCYAIINSIVIQEMLHMGLACNMLATLGVTPQIDTPEFIPTYPCQGLPGNVMPDITVSLQGFSADVVETTFMAIETPEQPLAVVPQGQDTALAAGAESGGRRRMILLKPEQARARAAAAPAPEQSYATIGAFYDAILLAFQGLSPSDFTGQNQVVIAGWGLIAINNLQDATNAINTIKEQGEGTSTNPYDLPDTTDPEDLAHYYKFGETAYGFTFENDNGTWGWTGAAITGPGDVYPVGTVPAGGYPDNQAVQAFDQTFSQLLVQLQAAWNTGSVDTLNDAIGMMGDLTTQAVKIMSTQIPDSNPAQNYAPDFKYIAQSQ